MFLGLGSLGGEPPLEPDPLRLTLIEGGFPVN